MSTLQVVTLVIGDKPLPENHWYVNLIFSISVILHFLICTKMLCYLFINKFCILSLKIPEEINSTLLWPFFNHMTVNWRNLHTVLGFAQNLLNKRATVILLWCRLLQILEPYQEMLQTFDIIFFLWVVHILQRWILDLFSISIKNSSEIIASKIVLGSNLLGPHCTLLYI